MTEHNVDPGQVGRSEQTSWQQARATKRWCAVPVHLTPLRVVAGILVLALLAISAGSLLTVRNSYASTNRSVAVLATGTGTPACNGTPTPTTTATSTTAPGTTPVGKTPTPRPTATKQPTPTPTDTPTPTPTDTPTPTPTDTPTPTPTDTPTADSGSVTTQKLSYTVQCPAVPTATVPAGSTPATGSSTSATAPVSTNGNSGSSTPGLWGGVMRLAAVIGGVFLVLLFALGIGWYVFRRTLMPQQNTKLPPSGARPWSRTRVPNPDSLGGANSVALAGANGAMMYGAPNQNNGFVPQNNGYIQEFGVINNGPNGPAGFGPPQGMNGYAGQMGNGPASFNSPQGMNGYGTPAAGFDGFILPSPQIFSRGDASMISSWQRGFPRDKWKQRVRPEQQCF